MPNVLTVTNESHISADGFSVEVKNGEEVLFKKNYMYGYDASYKKDFAEESKPFKGDIISGLCSEYGIDEKSVVYQEGRNVFKESMMRRKKESERETVDVSEPDSESDECSL